MALFAERLIFLDGLIPRTAHFPEQLISLDGSLPWTAYLSPSRNGSRLPRILAATMLSFIGMDGEPSFRHIASKITFIESKEELTRHEKEVLKLLIDGKLSKEISGILKISKAIRYGWL